MPLLLRVFIITLCLAGPVHPQSGPTSGFDAPENTAETFADPMAVPIPTETLPDVQREQHGNWTIICAGQTDFCAMKTLGLNADGSPAIEVEVVKLPRDVPPVAGMTILTPLGVLLEPGLITQVDETPPKEHIYQICTPAGCLARFALTEETLAEHERGTILNVAVWAVNVPQNPVPVTVSLSGFTAAFAALKPQALP